MEGKSFGMEGGDLGREGRLSQNAADNLSSHALVSSIVWGLGITPRPTTTDTFGWAGGSASPHTMNAMGHEETSLLNYLLMPPTRARLRGNPGAYKTKMDATHRSSILSG